MTKILFVIGSLEVGGAETHLVQIACELKARGWEPLFFVFKAGGPLTPKLQQQGIHISTGPVLPGSIAAFVGKRLLAGISSLAMLFSIARVMLTKRPAIVHFFLPSAYLLGGLASLLTGTRPRIMSRRSLNNYQQKRQLLARLERRLHSHMDVICGNSRAVIDQLISEGAPRDRLNLIYNGISCEHNNLNGVRNAVRRELRVHPDAMVFSKVANLIPYKGHHDLIQAFAKIREKLPINWVCLMIGRDDGIGNELRAAALESGLTANFFWLGSRSDVPALLAATDIGILCSHEEGFSNAVLEIMAAGLPMVVTNVGGNAEAVVDGETGYVVPAHDPVALGCGILKLVGNPHRRDMGLKGRSRVQEFFSLEACVDTYEVMYRQLLS